MKLICVRLSCSVLLVCSYNPIFCNLLVHLNIIDKTIEFYSEKYDKVLIAGDLNAQESDIKLDMFCSIWNLKSLETAHVLKTHIIHLAWIFF